MRLIAITVTAALFAVGLTAAPAVAADATVVVHGPDDFAENFNSNDDAAVSIRECSNPRNPGAPTGNTGFSILDTNDPDQPLGTSKMGVAFEDPSVSAGPMAFTSSPTTLATYTVRAQAIESGSTGGAAFAFYFPSAVSGADYWKGFASLNLTQGWQTADALSLSMAWSKYSGTTGDQVSGSGNGTVAAFATANGGDAGGAIVGMAFGCGKQVYFDRLRVGPSGSVTTFDFERTLSKTSIAASKTSVVAGTTVTLTSQPTSLTGVPFSSAQVTLEQKPFGASSFTPVGTATATAGDVGSESPARILVKPTVQTQYRWVFAGGQSAAPSTSSVVTVKVAAGITVKAGSVAKGKSAKVTGKVTPKQGGISLTLQAKINGKWVDWDTGKTKGNGTYALASPKLTKPGKIPVRVVSKAAPGLLKGTSKQAKVTVTG